MAKPEFSVVWNRIAAVAGEEFRTIRGLPFSFELDRDSIIPNRTDYRLSRADFESAYEHVPISGPGRINDEVRGPSYIWAILHDRRVAKGDWQTS